jgi:hypothetical protein
MVEQELQLFPKMRPMWDKSCACPKDKPKHYGKPGISDNYKEKTNEEHVYCFLERNHGIGRESEANVVQERRRRKKAPLNSRNSALFPLVERQGYIPPDTRLPILLHNRTKRVRFEYPGEEESHGKKMKECIISCSTAGTD